jgi:hypothetical protein
MAQYYSNVGPGSGSSNVVDTIGTIDSVAPSSDGAVIFGSALIMQAASASEPGLVTTAAQTMAGNKTLSGGMTLPIGAKILIKEGSNARMGQATLVAGTVDVANTSVAASTRVFLSCATPGGTQGFLSSANTAGVKFTINSSDPADTSVVNWLLIDPAP